MANSRRSSTSAIAKFFTLIDAVLGSMETLDDRVGSKSIDGRAMMIAIVLTRERRFQFPRHVAIPRSTGGDL